MVSTYKTRLNKISRGEYKRIKFQLSFQNLVWDMFVLNYFLSLQNQYCFTITTHLQFFTTKQISLDLEYVEIIFKNNPSYILIIIHTSFKYF